MQSCTLKSVFTKLLVKNTNLCLWKDSSLNLGPGLITLDIDSSAKDLHHCWGTASRRLSTHPQLCNMETCLPRQPLWNGNLPEMGTSLKWKPAYEDKHRLINQDLREIYKGGMNSRIHHFLPECIALNHTFYQNALHLTRVHCTTFY